MVVHLEKKKWFKLVSNQDTLLPLYTPSIFFAPPKKFSLIFLRPRFSVYVNGVVVFFQHFLGKIQMKKKNHSKKKFCKCLCVCVSGESGCNLIRRRTRLIRSKTTGHFFSNYFSDICLIFLGTKSLKTNRVIPVETPFERWLQLRVFLLSVVIDAIYFKFLIHLAPLPPVAVVLLLSSVNWFRTKTAKETINVQHLCPFALLAEWRENDSIWIFQRKQRKKGRRDWIFTGFQLLGVGMRVALSRHLICIFRRRQLFVWQNNCFGLLFSFCPYHPNCFPLDEDVFIQKSRFPLCFI